MNDSPVPVWVTGLGVVSAWGDGVSPFWDGLRSGRSSISALHRFSPERHRTSIASEVRGPASIPRGSSRADAMAVSATREALASAGLSDSLPGQACGVFFGGSTAGMWESECFLADLHAEPSRRCNIHDLSAQQINAPADEVARQFSVEGPVETHSAACASAAYAIGAALDELHAGAIEVAIVGGVDSLCELTYAGFNSLRAVDERPARPFRLDREGLSLGEGAAVLVLEGADRARARGARSKALLLGAGFSCDAYHMTAPEPSGEGAERAIGQAMTSAGITAEQIDFINAHGTGTPLNDAAEAAALRSRFGDRIGSIPLTSTKAVVGHWLGSSGAIEAVATCLCLMHGEVHPTPGEGPSDIEPGIDLVVGQPRALSMARTALSTSFGFGGANGALLFGAAND